MRRGWHFVSPGRGEVAFERVFRALNAIGYQGPLSIEWEDSGMDREQGAPEALAFVRRTDLTASQIAFDAALHLVGVASDRHRVVGPAAGGLEDSRSWPVLTAPCPGEAPPRMLVVYLMRKDGYSTIY